MSNTPNNTSGGAVVPVLSPKTYDALKFVAQIFLPALGALYFALAGLWGFPNPTEVIGTITAIDVFLGIVLGLSSANYNKSGAGLDGDLVVDTSDPTTDRYNLALTTPLEGLAERKTITLKVKPAESSTE